MAVATSNGIDVWYEVFGDAGDPPLLLVMGLGGQAIAWDDGFVEALVDRGFFVIRYDNRDTGLSTHFTSWDRPVGEALMALLGGEPVEPPYLLSDMAADGVSVLDDLGVDSAHVVGQSMGGMIVQQIAIDHRSRVRTLTSIFSNTGEPGVGGPDGEAAAALIRPAPTNRQEAIESSWATWQVIGTQSELDEAKVRADAARAYDRAFDPAGVGRQMVAIYSSGSRAEGLRNLDVPTLVVHGTADRLVQVDGGKRTAELVPGAELLLVDGMGHDLPPVHVPQIVTAITNLAGKWETDNG